MLRIAEDPPGCWLIQLVRSYTFPLTIVQQLALVLCAATVDFVIPEGVDVLFVVVFAGADGVTDGEVGVATGVALTLGAEVGSAVAPF